MTMHDLPASNAQWTMKVIVAWLYGFLGDALSLSHAILGNLVLIATLVFTVLQIIKLYRELWHKKLIEYRNSHRAALRTDVDKLP